MQTAIVGPQMCSFGNPQIWLVVSLFSINCGLLDKDRGNSLTFSAEGQLFLTDKQNYILIKVLYKKTFLLDGKTTQSKSSLHWSIFPVPDP